MAQVLRPLQEFFPKSDNPELILGLSSGDDAAVYRLNDDTALIFTLDFFTPVVDDPFDYGTIAAVNAISDVYAMGGKPVLALNICAFPPSLPQELITEILKGGADAVSKAGGILAGGHTISDEEPKYGLAVIGICHPDAVLKKSGAKPGDYLVLTKSLGTGVITTAAKADADEQSCITKAVESMKRSHAKSSQLLSQFRVHSCTDVTGFGLIGHAADIAQQSGVTLAIGYDALPFLPGAIEYAENGMFPGGACRNEAYYQPLVHWECDFGDAYQTLLYSPETSGGLLASVDADDLGIMRKRFREAEEDLHVIGRVEKQGDHPIRIW